MKTNAQCADATLVLVCLLVAFVLGWAGGMRTERAEMREQLRDNPCFAVESETGADAVIYRESSR